MVRARVCVSPCPTTRAGRPPVSRTGPELAVTAGTPQESQPRNYPIARCRTSPNGVIHDLSDTPGPPRTGLPCLGDPRMNHPARRRHRPAARRQGRRDRRDRARAARLHDPGRPRRRRDPGRAARRAAARRAAPRCCSTAAGPAWPSTSSSPRPRPIVLELVGGADVLVEGMRPGVAERLGIGPDQCHAVNPRLVYGRMTGWGQDGPLAQVGRPRHELHLGRRRAVRPRPDAGPAAVPDQPGRRLRRRLDVPRHRPPGRAARGAGHGAGPGRGRGDRRRHRPPQRDDLGVPGQRRLPGEPRAANLLDGGVPYYDVYETSDGRHMSVGAAGAAVLRGAGRDLLGLEGAAPGQVRARDRYDELRGLLTDDVPAADPGRVGRAVRGHRRLRGRDHPDQRGRRAPAPRGPPDLRRARGAGAAAAGAAVLPHRCRRSRCPRRRSPARTPARRWPPGASPTSTG